MRFIAKIMLVALLATACSPRGQVIIEPQAASVGKVHEIFVATTRGRGNDKAFNGSRSDTLSFLRYDISVPPQRSKGEINWPPRGKNPPDASKYFLTTAAGSYQSEAAFTSDLARSIRSHKGDAVIFIHGFNNNFAEGLYRNAQMVHDMDIPATAIHYSWPSAAQPLGYVYDRDSSLYARDGLMQLVNDVDKAGAKRIILIAHSMGSALLMESLRSISLAGRGDLLKRLGGVVLISPDIDIDLFRAQALQVKPLPQPFIVFSSEKDRILKISATLTGQSERLGTLTNLEKVADLPITVLDTAAFSKGAGHFNLGDNPALLRVFDGLTAIDQSLSAERAARTGLIPGVVLTAQNATQVVLKPVLVLSGN